MPIEKLKPTFSFDEERIKKLREIAPEAFADNQINWEVLREALGDYLEEDDLDTEHFGLFWPGKREARRIASIPSKGTLVPVYGEGLKKDGTPDRDGENDSSNIFIEGENLEVLKILQKSYAGRIKMIYIDPPYNTGNDFVYDDNFTEPLEEYLRRTGQIDEEGKPLTTNKKADGRFHSKWLSMMYPRLRLARNLLKDDGVIFISIDDNENYHLRNICDEIFGPENFVGTIKRKAARKTANLSNTMSDMCDYIVIYSKSELSYPLSISKASDKTRPVFNAGNAPSERIIPTGTKAKCEDCLISKGKHKVRSLEFELNSDLKIKDGKTQSECKVFGPWRVNQEILNETIYITKNKGFRRYVTDEELEKAKAMNDLLDSPDCYNEKGSEDLEKLLDIANIFNNPKPIELIKYLIKAISSYEDDDHFILLDFFAGSGTTGHAVYNFNEENEKNIKYICVQYPEPIEESTLAYQEGFRAISEITLKRLKSAAETISNKFSDKGFFKLNLSQSNYINWKDYIGNSVSEIDDLFDSSKSLLKENWSESNLLIEIILLEGFPIESHFQSVNYYTKNKIILVTSNVCQHKLLICLDEKIQSETINNLQLSEDDIFICLDTAITDQEKVILSDKGLIKTI